MYPYERYLKAFTSQSLPEMYSVMTDVAQDIMELDELPFPLSALEHPPGGVMDPEVVSFILKVYRAGTCDNSDENAISLIQFLKENPPGVSYKNPELHDYPKNFVNHIVFKGIDLPGSMYNLSGHLQYFSSFFIDMFFGNYTEFIGYVDSLSKDELDKALNKREGFCQHSPIFAPILGLRLVDLEDSIDFTAKERKEIRSMYSLNNENKHLNILTKLIELGADVNAHDINGFTPLHYACTQAHAGMIKVLLKHGADPNSESCNDVRPLAFFKDVIIEKDLNIIQLLLEYNAKLTGREHINELRSNVELYGCKHLLASVREAHLRDKDECEKCGKLALKKCGACGLVHYCTPACQKLDWKIHKLTCKKGQTKMIK